MHQRVCTCDVGPEEEGYNKSKALKYKFVDITAILVASEIDVCLPILDRVVHSS